MGWSKSPKRVLTSDPEPRARPESIFQPHELRLFYTRPANSPDLRNPTPTRFLSRAGQTFPISFLANGGLRSCPCRAQERPAMEDGTSVRLRPCRHTAGCPRDVRTGRLRHGISTARGALPVPLWRRFPQTKPWRRLPEICNRYRHIHMRWSARSGRESHRLYASSQMVEVRIGTHDCRPGTLTIAKASSSAWQVEEE